MKRILLSFALLIAGFTFAQDYYDTYPQNYNGYEYYNNSYDYPDNYYYNYPVDYYPDAYYQGYYNDYNRAVFSVDWNRFFVQFNLSPWQVNQIILLNNRFPSFAAWNSYYRWNPDRWYYDRFFALQNILGPNIFVIYQNVYFRGRSPIIFYRNRCVNFYAARYPVRPVYRNININIYRVDRSNFRNGFREPVRNNIQSNSPRSGVSGGFSNPGIDNSSGIRNSQNGSVRDNNGGRLENVDNGSIRTVPSPRNETRNRQGDFRNNSEKGIRSLPNSREQQNSVPRNNSNGRSSGIRIASR